MSGELTCPYCQADVDPNYDRPEPNEHIEIECDKCLKSFGYQLEYYPSYTEYELPCANGEPHNYKEIKHYVDPNLGQRYRCSYCDEELWAKYLSDKVDRHGKMIIELRDRLRGVCYNNEEILLEDEKTEVQEELDELIAEHDAYQKVLHPIVKMVDVVNQNNEVIGKIVDSIPSLVDKSTIIELQEAGVE